MSEDAAILAQFSDWRTVKGRKVLQLIFEVPLEDQAKVLTHLGAPMPTADLWCGIARVARKGKAGGDAAGIPNGSDSAPAIRPSSPATNSVTPAGGETGGVVVPSSFAPPVPKHKRRWSEMPPSQRAALALQDEEFRSYVCGMSRETVPCEVDADGCLKARLGIVSKSDLDRNAAKASAFDRMYGDFQATRQARGHGVI